MIDPAHPPAPPYIDLTRPHVRCYVTGPVPLPAACRAAVDALAAAVAAAADAIYGITDHRPATTTGADVHPAPVVAGEGERRMTYDSDPRSHATRAQLRTSLLGHLNAAHRELTAFTGPYDAADLTDVLDALDGAIATVQTIGQRTDA